MVKRTLERALCAVLFCVPVLAFGCDDSGGTTPPPMDMGPRPVEIDIYVYTDWQPGTDFTLVEFGGLGTTSRTVATDTQTWTEAQPFLIGTRFYQPGDSFPGELHVWNGGTEIYTRPVPLVAGMTNSSITLRVTSNCEMVSCMSGQACIDAVCVPETCFSGNEATCQ